MTAGSVDNNSADPPPIEAERERLQRFPFRSPRTTIMVVVFVVVWGLITHGTYAGGGDEPHYLMIAHSLAFDRDLDLANDYAGPTLIGGGTLMPELHAIPGKDGTLRPVHDIGLPLLAAPLVRVLYPFAEWAGRGLPPDLLRRSRLNPAKMFRHLVSLAMVLVAGLLAVQLFEILRRDGIALRHALAWSLLFVLSPPLISHAFLFFTEIPSTLLLVWVVRTLSGTRLRDPHLGARTTTGPAPGWVGAAIGLLLLIHVRNIALVALLLPWAAWVTGRNGRRRDMAALLVAALIPIGIRSAATWTFWGTLLTTPIAHGDSSLPLGQGLSMTAQNLARIFADVNIGLLRIAPIYLLAIPGFVLLWRRDVKLALPLIVLAGSYVASITMPWINPHGIGAGFSPAARLITPIVPLLAIPAALAADRLRGAARSGVIILVLAQLGFDIVMWQHPKQLWVDSDRLSISAPPNRPDPR